MKRRKLHLKYFSYFANAVIDYILYKSSPLVNPVINFNQTVLNARLSRRVLRLVIFFTGIIFLYIVCSSLYAVNYTSNAPHPDIANSIGFKQNLFEYSTIGRINYDIWTDGVYIGFNVDDLRIRKDWPNNPTERLSTSRLKLEYNKVDNLGVKMYGYLLTSIAGEYDFKIIMTVCTAALNGEFWLSTDADPVNLRKLSVLSYHKMDRGMFSSSGSSKPVSISLKADTSYYMEFHVKGFDGRLDMEVLWKTPLDTHFTHIEPRFIAQARKLVNSRGIEKSPAQNSKSLLVSLPSNKLQTYNHHTSFNNKHKHGVQLNVLPECVFFAAYALRRRVSKYEGVKQVFESHVYPSDNTEHKYNRKYIPGNKPVNITNVYRVLKKYSEVLRQSEGYSYKIIDLHYMEETINKDLGVRYLLELDILMDHKVIHTSEYIYWDKHTDRLCTPINFHWDKDVDVNIIITVKDLSSWVRHLIHNMEDDERFQLIIVDYQSTDIDIKDELKDSILPRWKVIQQSGEFSRSVGLQTGIDYISDPNSIIMMIDLHLTIPMNFITSIRKNVIQGKMAFTPMFFKLSAGYTEININGYWEDETYGLFGMYKSDWSRVGGFDTKTYKTRWGGEDWDLLDRTLSMGIEVFRIRFPGLFHYYHTKSGMWGLPKTNLGALSASNLENKRKSY